MNVIRPTSLNDFVGQQNARRILTVLITASKKRNEAAPHLLMSGGAGLGKTTLARIVANEMGAPIRATSGPAIEDTATALVGDEPSGTLV